MVKSRIISALIKAAPALAISSTLLFPTFYSKHYSSFAQSPDIAEASALDNSDRASINLNDFSGTHFRRPRNSRSRSGSRTTTATRQDSCLSDAKTAFALLGPEAEIGQTSSTHPAFVWYLPDSADSYPVTFRLLAPNASGIPTPIHTAELSYAAGFRKYQLPASLPALTSGKEYRWQIVIECNPNYPSQSLSQELSFEVVSPTAELSQALAGATTEADIALAYGQSGLWYEAIAQVAQSAASASQSVRTGLLQNLSELESENAQFSTDLAAIADTTAR